MRQSRVPGSTPAFSAKRRESCESHVLGLKRFRYATTSASGLVNGSMFALIAVLTQSVKAA